MRTIIALLIITGLSVTKVHAQAPDPDTTALHFIIMASINNIQEVNTGKMAAQRATRADVKSFGQMMVTDHTQAEQKLLQLASSRGYDIPAAAKDTPPNDLNLTKVSGDDFDRMYIHAMVAGHRSTVIRFQVYATTGKDPEVKAFAQQMLSIVLQHLAVIKALDGKYKGLSAK